MPMMWNILECLGEPGDAVSTHGSWDEGVYTLQMMKETLVGGGMGRGSVRVLGSSGLGIEWDLDR